MNIEFEVMQIRLTSDKKAFINHVAEKIKEALIYVIDVFPKYNDYGASYADIENYEILFENNIVVFVSASIEDRNDENIITIEEIAVQLDGEEVDLIIDNESFKDMKSTLKRMCED